MEKKQKRNVNGWKVNGWKWEHVTSEQLWEQIYKNKITRNKPLESFFKELTSSRMRFLALVIAMFRTLIQDSFSSGLTAKNTRLGV